MAISKANIGQALHSVADDHVTAVANDIYDETLQKYQSEINAEVGQGDGVYDISAAYPSLSPFASLQAALTAFTDTTKKKGGMTIKYIGTDGKYHQYRYTGTSIADADFNNGGNWVALGLDYSDYSGTKVSIPSTIHERGMLLYDDTWRSIETIDCYITELIPCKEGDKFIWRGSGNGAYTDITEVTSGSNIVTWIFYNSSLERVSSWSVCASTRQVTIPSGVSYVKFAGLAKVNSNVKDFSVWYYEIDNKLIQDVKRITDKLIQPSIHYNGLLWYDDTWRDINTIDTYVTELIPCKEGDRFVWRGSANGAFQEPTQINSHNDGATAWIFYNSSLERVSSWAVGKSTQIVVIPNGVYYVKFAGLARINADSKDFSVWHDETIADIASNIGNLSNKWKGLKWVCFGDSLTESNQRATKNYHDYIHDWTGITVVNRGVSGSGYKFLFDENKAFYQKVQTQADADADVITFFGSGNDLHIQSNGDPIYQLGDIDDTGTETICGCINTTFDWLMNNRPLTPLGVISMTPWIGGEGRVSVPAQEEYCLKLSLICKKRGIPFLDLYYNSNLHPRNAAFRNVAYKRDGAYTRSSSNVEGAIQVTSDNLSIVRAFGVSNANVGDYVLPNLTGVHPDEDGHKLIAPRFKAFLETLIEK